jgi:hypothetical protein
MPALWDEIAGLFKKPESRPPSSLKSRGSLHPGDDEIALTRPLDGTQMSVFDNG